MLLMDSRMQRKGLQCFWARLSLILARYWQLQYHAIFLGNGTWDVLVLCSNAGNFPGGNISSPKPAGPDVRQTLPNFSIGGLILSGHFMSVNQSLVEQVSQTVDMEAWLTCCVRIAGCDTPFTWVMYNWRSWRKRLFLCDGTSGNRVYARFFTVG